MKQSGWKQTVLIIGAAGAAIAAITFAVLLFTARTYTIYMRESQDGYEAITAEYDNEGIVEMIGAEKNRNEVWEVRFRAVKPGDTVIRVRFAHSDRESYQGLQDTYGLSLHVTRCGTILEPADLDFNGFYVLCGGLAAFFLFAGCLLLRQYRKRKATRFFFYGTVLRLGIGGFLLLQGLLFLALIIACTVFPEEANGRILFFAAQYAMSALTLVSFPFVLLLAAGMSISNVWLIRHEGLRKTNLLAMTLAILLVGGVSFCILLTIFNTQMLALEPKTILISFGRTLVSTLYLYFAAILVATQYCCVIAARRKPAPDRDYVLILGCAIRKDGTLYPLLKGRADRAAAFYWEQKEKTGKAPVLVPSGGRGSDEIMAEGEAVRRYLLEQGIPESDILAETQSTNTAENMAFSKALIDARSPQAKVAFSTTNYHVFRSGILASDIGLRAESMASKTKWYFWPNAQIREFVGLLARSWKLHIVLGLLLTAFSLLLANLGTIVNYLIT